MLSIPSWFTSICLVSQNDRQNRQTDRQASRKVGRQVDRQTRLKICRQNTGRLLSKQADSDVIIELPIRQDLKFKTLKTFANLKKK